MHAKKARKKHGFSTKPCLWGCFFGLKCVLYPIFRRVTINWNDLIVRRKDIERFEAWAAEESGQPDEKSPHEHSCVTIAAMVDAWDSIIIKKEMPVDIPDIPGKKLSGISAKVSFKQAVRAYLHHKHKIPVSEEKIKKGENIHKFSPETIKQMGALLNACITPAQWKALFEENNSG